MKKAKLKNIPEQKKEVIVEEEPYSIKSLIKIVLIISVVFGAFYFITTLVVKEETTENEVSQGVIDSEKMLLSNLLKKKDSEYYVLATMESKYTSKSNYSELYNKYINDYSQSENAIPVYSVDLDDALNKKHVGEETNITEDIDKLVLSDEVLFKIKDSKIESYYVGSSEIIGALKQLKES